MSAGSLEFRQRFLESFGVATFVDAGQASANGKPFTNDWRIGLGFYHISNAGITRENGGSESALVSISAPMPW